MKRGKTNKIAGMGREEKGLTDAKCPMTISNGNNIALK